MTLKHNNNVVGQENYTLNDYRKDKKINSEVPFRIEVITSTTGKEWYTKHIGHTFLVLPSKNPSFPSDYYYERVFNLPTFGSWTWDNNRAGEYIKIQDVKFVEN